MFSRMAVGRLKKRRTVGFSSNLRVTAYSYVKMLKIRAKPCKNKMNLINSQQGHFRYAAQPVMGPQGSLRLENAYRATLAGWLKT
jgi:predicted DNA-binding ribbon-helix-helix protein